MVATHARSARRGKEMVQSLAALHVPTPLSCNRINEGGLCSITPHGGGDCDASLAKNRGLFPSLAM